jgi:hypothetical protein
MVPSFPLREWFRVAELRDLVHVYESPLIACDAERGESAFAKPPLDGPPSYS